MNNKIKCPNCGHEFDVEEAISGQLDAHYKAEYEKKLAEQAQKLKTEKDQLDKERDDFLMQKEEQDKLLKSEVEKALQIEKQKIESDTKEKYETQIISLQDENEKRKAENKELKQKEVELMRREAELNDKQEDLQLEAEKQLLEKREEIEKKAQAKAREKFEMEKRELEKKLEDQKALTEEMRRKQKQGSMQMQGEVQELAIEEWLISQFPLDTIGEIKKGARGGDCIQTVNTRTRQDCGKIYYESKRTKDFQPSWIEKFKADMREKEADIGVIITEAMPSELDRIGIIDGIWICTYEEFKGLCLVLRESVIQVSLAIQSQENKGDKMHLLYDYLTTNTFRMRIEAIVEGFSSMKNNLESEKRSMQRIWKEREKQIDKVITNTIDMYGSIKGIAGSSIQPVKALELGEGFVEEEHDTE